MHKTRLVRALPYIIAIACILFMASNVLGQDKARIRIWRVTYWSTYELRDVRGKPTSLRDCIARLAEIYKQERINTVYCTADRFPDES